MTCMFILLAFQYPIPLVIAYLCTHVELVALAYFCETINLGISNDESGSISQLIH